MDMNTKSWPGCSVFKPGPVVDPIQGPGHQVNSNFFYKSKRRRFGKKYCVNGLQPSFLPVHWVTGSPGFLTTLIFS
jgi:hypothetical protein